MVGFDEGTALAYANFGAGSSPVLMSQERRVKELEIWFHCARVAQRVSGRNNSVADPLPRYFSGEIPGRVRGKVWKDGSGHDGA